MPPHASVKLELARLRSNHNTHHRKSAFCLELLLPVDPCHADRVYISATPPSWDTSNSGDHDPWVESSIHTPRTLSADIKCYAYSDRRICYDLQDPPRGFQEAKVQHMYRPFLALLCALLANSIDAVLDLLRTTLNQELCSRNKFAEPMPYTSYTQPSIYFPC
jgi:hypothetical protein